MSVAGSVPLRETGSISRAAPRRMTARKARGTERTGCERARLRTFSRRVCGSRCFHNMRALPFPGWGGPGVRERRFGLAAGFGLADMDAWAKVGIGFVFADDFP